MSLTTNDLGEIRTIIRDEVRSVVRTELQPIEKRLDRIEGKLNALESDVKELYFMVSDLQKTTITDKSFRKLNLEQKLLTINAELLSAAKQAGVSLPR